MSGKLFSPTDQTPPACYLSICPISTLSSRLPKPGRGYSARLLPPFRPPEQSIPAGPTAGRFAACSTHYYGNEVILTSVELNTQKPDGVYLVCTVTREQQVGLPGHTYTGAPGR
ncbi:hypothetical protein Bbelb_224350 [Branchiostoma belcheri]|nr:hypothetical protein Bbelb_224350 [Branchiostoma belcheri]